jgi:(S)-2-hydroxyglutarate dehydrogenase
MGESKPYDVAIVGGGIVGLATALALVERGGARVVLLEAEERIAAHQTGHNSGVIHSGLYYRPGSLKARNCAAGREALYRFCEERGVACERCGKLVAASRPEEIPRLDELERRGRENGLEGLRRLAPGEVREREPHVACVDALLVPQTGIVDFEVVSQEIAAAACERGAELRLGTRVFAALRDGPELAIETSRGELRARHLIGCAGLQSDRLARACGVEPGLRIVPFRGEYFELVPERRRLVNDLVYPVPDPRFPFLGAHFTRMIDGGVEAGPNAVLALAREGYRRFSISARDVLSFSLYPGFWKLALRYWRTGLAEIRRSLFKRAFVAALRRMLPEIETADVRRAKAGIRAQALQPDGGLSDDFRIVEAPRMIHVLNAPSPAATAALEIGRNMAKRANSSFEL